ncbi:hypothetical protein Tco_1568893 [Tanacetum coccineum]
MVVEDNEFQRQKYFTFEMFESDWTMENARDLDNTLRSILLGALRIYNKERIYGKLEMWSAILMESNMTLPRLMRHKYMWDSEMTMKLLYDVTVCLDDRRPGSNGSSLEAEFLKKNNEDKVFKNKKNNIHRKYMELGS